MGFGVGQREYHGLEPAINLRSVSAKRAAIIRWHKSHPHSFRLFQKADRQLDKTCGKVRAYNETMYDLEKRLSRARSARSKLPLVASLARISNLKEAAERKIKEQARAREDLTQRLSDWRETLPLLDEEIDEGRKQRRG